MAGTTYMAGRQRYDRPQGIMFAENSGTIVNQTYVPIGQEVDSVATITAVDDAFPGSGTVQYTANNSFQIGDNVVISGFSIEGFNGTFAVTAATATYFRVSNSTLGTPTLTNAKVAALGTFLILSDHNRSPITISPIRIETRRRMVNARMRSYHIADKRQISVSWEMLPSRSFSKNPEFNPTTGDAGATALLEYTADGGAGGVELLDWYENHKGSFWVYLAYDKYNNFESVVGPVDKYGNLGKYNQILEMFVSDFSYTINKRGGTNHDLWTVSVTLEEV